MQLEYAEWNLLIPDNIRKHFMHHQEVFVFYEKESIAR